MFSFLCWVQGALLNLLFCLCANHQYLIRDTTLYMLRKYSGFWDLSREFQCFDCFNQRQQSPPPSPHL